MEKWTDKVAFVTGANGGIGSAIIEKLVQAGIKVVGFDRNLDKIKELAERLEGGAERLYPLEGDVTKEDDVISAFQWAEVNVGKISLLVNNAGIVLYTDVSDFEAEKWHDIYKVNVFGVGLCCREAIKSMKKNEVEDGLIININSLAGHCLLPMPKVGAYTMTKHDITNITQLLRRELVESSTNIKITSLSPGWVKAGMALPFYEQNPNRPGLNAEDVANAILYVLSVPPHVNITELSILPNECS